MINPIVEVSNFLIENKFLKCSKGDNVIYIQYEKSTNNQLLANLLGDYFPNGCEMKYISGLLFFPDVVIKGGKVEWGKKEVKNYTGYWACKNGDIFCDNYMKKEGLMRKLKPSDNGQGYMRVGVHSNNQQRLMRVHRMVAMAFLPVSEKKYVNHINGIKDDNRLCNLEWCTSSENRIHAVKMNLHNIPEGEAHHASKLTRLNVIEIKTALVNGKRGIVKQLGEKFGVTKQAISNIKKGKSWKHVKI